MFGNTQKYTRPVSLLIKIFLQCGFLMLTNRDVQSHGVTEQVPNKLY